MKLKNFRRVAALGMAVGMTAVLAACGNTADTASSEAAESTAETADTAEKASAETADAEYAYLADFSFSDAFDENGYLKGVTATDYVTLPDDYADITISADLGQVSDDDINDYIDSNVLSNFATTNEVKDRAAADGDTVNIGRQDRGCDRCADRPAAGCVHNGRLCGRGHQGQRRRPDFGQRHLH